MARTVNQRELRNDSGDIMRAVEAGETVVVTRNGVPMAELRPLRRRTTVLTAAVLDEVRHLPRIDAARLRADIDEMLDQDIDP